MSEHPEHQSKQEAEMKVMNDRWARLHELLGTKAGDDWDNAPFEALAALIASQERMREALKVARNCQLPVWVMKVIDAALSDVTEQKDLGEKH